MDCLRPSSVKDRVQVAVHIRPLIPSELLQGCRDCIGVVPNEPQIRLGAHTFTFDHVYGGSNASPASDLFNDCVAPLVDGLFGGYNATVFAYGQTGSGKTYTMGTVYTSDGCKDGIMPQVMEMLFSKMSQLKGSTRFQVRASFIEILKEEIRDLLGTSTPKSEHASANGNGARTPVPCHKPTIQVRESTAGEITLAAQGSLYRATGSTNMNSQSSRSHAIFTITLEQWKKSDCALGDEFLCGKLHLVDLAGSERAKKTGTDGMRFREGVHINKGLLALGNVISALGEDKKRRETRHVPYRDSKLTRILQDSLGGNSRTVMIACVSPADSNAEETLNTLKYANRARNIQNKPIVNRDSTGTEIQKLQEQLSLLQSELLSARESESPLGLIEVFKRKLACLEASNQNLRRELQVSQQSILDARQRALNAQVERDTLLLKLDKMDDDRNAGETVQPVEVDGMVQGYLTRIHELESELLQLQTSCSRCTGGCDSSENQNCSTAYFDENHSLDTPFDALRSPNEVVEADALTAKELAQHLLLKDCLDKELHELNCQLKEKEAEMQNMMGGDHKKKLAELEEERKYFLITDLKKQQEKQAQLLRSKQKSDEAARRLQTEIHRIKQQKVHLHNRMKQEAENFRNWKACREKEVLKLRKEGRRNVYEMNKLQSLHARQKLVLHRKTAEAAAATRKLKVLEGRKLGSRDSFGVSNKGSMKTLQWLDQELESAVRLREARSSSEKQSVSQDEEVAESTADAPPSPCATDAPSMSSYFNAHSDSPERPFGNSMATVDVEDECTRWEQVRTLGDAKDLLNFVFNIAACTRCDLRERENENKMLKERIEVLNNELGCRVRELEELIALARPSKETSCIEDRDEYPPCALGAIHVCDEENNQLHIEESDHPTCAQNACESVGNQTRKQPGRSRHHKWSLQFKWKWHHKPWRLSQWMRQNGKQIREPSVLRVLDVI